MSVPPKTVRFGCTTAGYKVVKAKWKETNIVEPKSIAKCNRNCFCILNPFEIQEYAFIIQKALS